jgi:hypothetical protein
MKNLFILVLMLCGIVVNTNAQPLFQDPIIIQLQMQAKDLPDYSGSTQPVRRFPPYNKEQRFYRQSLFFLMILKLFLDFFLLCFIILIIQAY